MVRINLISPRNLADQHLIAEYYEILMLVSYARNYPKNHDIPEEYCLGKGHIKFFKNKLVYLKKRHEKIKKEMKRRGFRTKKTIKLCGFDNCLINDWAPQKRDFEIIKARLIDKITNKKDYYRYYGEKKEENFLIKLIIKT